jgi:hypothetical protein
MGIIMKVNRETLMFYVDKGYDWVLNRTYPMKDEEGDWDPPHNTDSALKDFRHVVTAFKVYFKAFTQKPLPEEFDYPEPYEISMDQIYWELEQQRDAWKKAFQEMSDKDLNAKVVNEKTGKELPRAELVFEHSIHQADMIGHITTKRGMRCRALKLDHFGTFHNITEETRNTIRSFKKPCC